MADPINPSKKRVVKKTDIKSSDKKSTTGTETKTVYRRDKVTPKKVVTTDYANYYTPKGGMMGGSTVLKKEKQKFDRSGKLKSITSLTPVKKMGGATDEKCWPGKPGCGHKKAQRVNNRRAAANKVPVGKIIGGIGAGVLGGLAIKNKDKIKETLGMKTGGPVKKISKMQMGGDPTKARKCPKGKCGKVSVAPIGGGMETMGSKIKSGLKGLFTKSHKAGPSGRKRIR
jgi:hypothetical protein